MSGADRKNRRRLEAMMKSTLKITSKGQVTFRKEVLDQLGVRPGDKITVEFVGPGRAEVRLAEPAAKLEAFVGCLKKAGARTLSLEEIKKIARDGWAGER
jgi:bifunctional DNA-binding transcriptional regulator/antitoxin component of YhaV-PrlF toxin-antitoxin module